MKQGISYENRQELIPRQDQDHEKCYNARPDPEFRREDIFRGLPEDVIRDTVMVA